MRNNAPFLQNGDIRAVPRLGSLRGIQTTQTQGSSHRRAFSAKSSLESGDLIPKSRNSVLLPLPNLKRLTTRARVCCSLANRSSDESIPTDATESCPFCVRVHLEAIIFSVESRRVCATKDAGHQPPAVVLLARVPPQSAKDPTLQLTPMTMLQRQRDFRFPFF